MNDAVIRRLAGAQSYQRGLDYFSHGHVESLENSGGSVHAVVRGNQDYTVRLTADDGVLDYLCDCPAGSEGAFCKHCVAAALAWLNRAAGPVTPSGRGRGKEPTLIDAGKILQAEDKDALVRMVLDWAKDDDRLYERLIVYAARHSGPGTAAATVRRAFEKAVRVRDFVPYREATGWACGVDNAIDSIEQLLNDGQAAGVIELCESALQSLLSAIQAVDDSDGHFGTLRDRLEEIHYRACQEARPDPAELARRLFQWELHSDFDVFFGAVARYAKILGAKGMKVYRELAEAEWEKVPARTVRPERSEWGQHFRITKIMESLAQAEGDVEQLVAVMSRDLSSAYGYLKIAEVYHEAGRHDEALLWTEKGLRAFPDHTDSRLREFAAEEYHRRRRHDDAMKLMWAEFSERPLLETYKTLKRHAKKAGEWPEWQNRSLAEIRLRIAKAKDKARGRTRPRWMQADDDHSALVEIFLYENDPEAAWREAQTGGCSDSLWLRLAAARERENPEDAAPIYLKQAEIAIAATRNGRYEDSVDLLVKAAAVLRRMDRSAEFVHHLDSLRVKYKIKRNFIKLVEQKRKALYLS
jgi:tetratricopeptide (TPR) repeat protein